MQRDEDGNPIEPGTSTTTEAERSTTTAAPR